MLKLIADLIRAGMAWHDLYRAHRKSRERDLEDRMAPHLAAAATDPIRFAELLRNLPTNELGELHRRLMARVTYFGTILNRRDRESYDTIVWSSHEVQRRLPDLQTGMIRKRVSNDGTTRPTEPEAGSSYPQPDGTGTAAERGGGDIAGQTG